MADEKPPTSPFTLNRTRVFLILMLVVALGLAATTIIGSLAGWQRESAEAITTETE